MAHDLKSALDAYWTAPDFKSMQSAYNEILLFGGKDGYPCGSAVRVWLVRLLRRIALWLERG